MDIRIEPSVIIAALVLTSIVLTGRMDLLPMVITPLMIESKHRNLKKK